MVAGGGPTRAETPASAADPWRLCAAFIDHAERALELPPHLLQAISKVESGRWDSARSALSAWPWTVMAEGRGRYLPSKAAAIAEVQALKARGVRNIDVGCMQVNLQFHPKAFDSLEQAFDPAQNVAYAATFLTRLRQETNSWTRAIGRYHSATPHLMGRYRLKVFRAWREEKRQAERERRAAREARQEAQHSTPKSPASTIREAPKGTRLVPAAFHQPPR
ncbi:MAG: transglycosylase SLT domain-containing protein [Kiloniellales bacterium]